MILQKDTDIIKKLAKEKLNLHSVSDIQRLGGMTNRTYKVIVDNKNFVFRIAGEGTESLINRKDEFESEKVAVDIGISVKVLFFNQDNGTKISKYIENAQTMSVKEMQKRENYLLAAKILKTLHTTDVDTGVYFDIFKTAKEYEDFILNNNVDLFADYYLFKKEVFDIKTSLEKFNQKIVPCHNDPLCENWVRSGDKMYLIDWEYAGMNDPFWDVADVSVESELTKQQDEDFLLAYLEKPLSEIDYKKFVVNKIYLDYLWSLWGKIRVPFDPLMELYAQARYERMKNNITFFKTL